MKRPSSTRAAPPSDAERSIVGDGRRWRRSDPSIPEGLRSELVHALMDARRAVGAAKRAEDPAAERSARRHVQDAKLALGERGPAWWAPQTDAALRPRIEAAVRALVRHRGPEKTICPSDVARIVGGASWRARMQTVRFVVLALVKTGALEVRQKGKVVPPERARGAIRLALPHDPAVSSPTADLTETPAKGRPPDKRGPARAKGRSG